MKTAIEIYLEKLSEQDKLALNEVCKIVREIAPDAEEAIYYGVPSFKLKSQLLLGIAAGKNFLSLYPSSAPIEKYAKQLANYHTSKGAIRFTHENPISSKLLKEIVVFRKNQILNKD